MTTTYNALVELDQRAEGVTDDMTDKLLEQLRDYAGIAGRSPRGWLELTLSLPATSLQQATTTALAVAVTLQAGTPIAVQVMTAVEFDRRHGFEPLPELLSSAEAAEVLGISRQRVGQLVEAGSLQGEHVGRALVLPRAAVEAFAARERGPGRPPKIS